MTPDEAKQLKPGDVVHVPVRYKVVSVSQDQIVCRLITDPWARRVFKLSSLEHATKVEAPK
jgi:hypothetical protein